MRTVPTLCATGAGISLSAVGLTLARENEAHAREQQSDMTAVASPYTLPLTSTRPTYFDSTSHRSFSSPSTRLARLGDHGRAYSSSNTRQKRSVSSRASLGLSMEPQTQGDEGNLSQAATSESRPRSWLRRLSSSMSASRDSSRTPTSTSRPGSSAISFSNGSMSFSQTGSTTPIFADSTSSPAQPNKLVKRTSSLRSSNGSPAPSSGSRLPLPVFRRPATSHQRSATFQESPTRAELDDRMSIDQKSNGTRDRSWQHYFTPKIARDDQPFGRRRSSTGIPNPIKRVYPDRKYTPILVSAKELVKLADLEVDDGLSMDGDSAAATKLRMVPSAASSPLPTLAAYFEESSAPRRSFSIGDMLSTGPQPLWRRPSSSKGNASGSTFSRKSRSRVVSTPQPAMGSTFSSVAAADGERPAKRRDVSDPQAGHRSIYSSSGSIPPADQQQHDIHLGLGSATPLSQHFSFADSPQTETSAGVAASSPPDHRTLPSANGESTAARHARLSAAQSEITASTVGSDSERRSVSGYSTDYQSDTVFDSFPTRTTRSSLGKRGPPIDTIFDESPPTFSSGRSTKLQDLLGDGYFPIGEHGTRYRHSTIEEEESVISTPVRSLHDKSMTSTPSLRPGAQQVFTSSPPVMSLMPDPDDIDWDAPDGQSGPEQGLGIQSQFDTPSKANQSAKMPFRLSAFSRPGNPTSAHSTPNRYTNGATDRANLFDWSEQQPSPRQSQSPPRPRTVHGKKDPENRGSRTAARRAPSGIHARSHSVPVVPDADGKRSVVANKFGTWGVGSKGVTEDWNEDFDFEEALSPPPLPDLSAVLQEKRVDSGHEMFVPRSIREQQENVVANIGLLREWGLLIEELKALRIRAVALEMLTGPFAKAWKEVDAMIELADQESEEHTLQPRRSPPSSPGFDYDEFDDPDVVGNGSSTPRNDSIRLSQAMEVDEEPGSAMMPADLGINFGAHGLTARPRKDSEAVARLVIEALQTRRAVSDPTALHPQQPAKKVPFDTATLRHIVPYVSGLKRKVKDALRETEGLYSSPRRRVSPDDTIPDREEWDVEPAFRSIFNEPGPDSPTSKRRARREAAATDNDGWDQPVAEDRNDLASRIERMTLSPS